MPTPAERNALLFLAAVTMLGGGVRAARAVADREAPTPAAERALVAQRDAVARESAAREARSGARSGTRQPRAAQPPRARGARAAPAGSGGPPLAAPRPPAPVDVDRATAAQLDALPRIGPALAGRIVADRDSLGPFGSLEALGRVRGVGPAMLERLRGHVTFSGTPRPTSAAAMPRARSRRPP